MTRPWTIAKSARCGLREVLPQVAETDQDANALMHFYLETREGPVKSREGPLAPPPLPREGPSIMK